VLSVALGLHLVGASAWAARLPLALWTLAGAWALYALVRRFEGKRAALLSVAILVTCPLVFAQARTALGDAVTMATLTFSFAGFVLAWGDERARLLRRVVWFGLGGLGAAAGASSPGVLLGVAVPTLRVGVAALVLGAPAKND